MEEKGLTWFLFCTLITCIQAVDTISANQTIRDGETIISAQQTFELGFFSPANTTNRYIGIWYKKKSTGTLVWVANRNTPLTNPSGEFTLTPQGVLDLRNATGSLIWSSGKSTARNPVAQLLDTGNFIVREEADSVTDTLVWQSFDFPTNTLLAGMKFGRDLVTGLDRHFVSWKSSDDPAPGEFTAWLDINGYPQVLVKDGSSITFRAGPWNGLRFSGEPNLRSSPIVSFKFVLNQREIYYGYDLIDTSAITRMVIQPTGMIDRLMWDDNRKIWSLYMSPQIDNCDKYALCGRYGSCDTSNSLACECLDGFEPTSPDQWNMGDWSQGCRRKVPLNCTPDEGFTKYMNMKLPDTQWSRFNLSMTTEDCERVCKSNCSCTAYTNTDITRGGSGCLLWYGDLIDIKRYSENGDDLYIRFPASELAKRKSSSVRRHVRIIVPIMSVVFVILISICLFYRFKTKKRKHEAAPIHLSGAHKEVFGQRSEESSKEDLELPLFVLSTLLKATNNFSLNNKLGEGGFGPVYKGVLKDGQEIAVKRLAKTSGQGLHEFKSEVTSISKLQHRNLVKLLGCCIQGEEKMLVYEYMPNKGLDSFIFDKNQSKLLDWPRRFHIINGIARGLLYLHQDSRLRIIHRDLKVSNILLDSDMNPKISDFGMARIFGRNQTEANTNRVVGTYGYMAPEYAGDGIFSIKSDVYSFGVLVLEIVSGQRNRPFFQKGHINNLIGHAWELHKEGRYLELVDRCLHESIDSCEVLRSFHVGLLCVQEDPEDRPIMTSVVLMLGSEGALPPPKQPGFFTRKTTADNEYSSSTYGTSSSNKLTNTVMDGR